MGTSLYEKLSHEELDRIFAMSQDLICIADINTATFKKINPAFTEVLGYSEKELVGKPFFEFIHPDDIETTRAVVEQKLKAGAGVINFENRYRCKDRGYRWLSWTSKPDREKGLTYAVARDISDKKQLERAATESRKLLEATSRMAKIGGWELDLVTRKIFWTQMTGKIHGLPDGFYPPLEEAISYYHPDDRKMVEDYVNHAIEQGTPYEFEARLVTPQGPQRWVRAIGEPTMEGGECIRLNGTIQDITERQDADIRMKALAEEVRLQRDTLQTLIETAPAGIVVTEEDGRISFHNRTADDMVGGSITDTAHGPESGYHLLTADGTPFPEEELPLVRAIRENQPVRCAELLIDWEDGSEVVALAHATSLRDEKGEVRGAIAVMQDITKRKQAEKALREGETRFRQLFEHMQSGVAIYEITANRDDFIFVDCNAALEEIEHLSRNEVIGKSLKEMYPAITETGLLDVLQRVWQTGVPETPPAYFYKDNRIQGWRENIVYKLPSGEIVAVFNDITRQREAEESVKQSESFLKILLDAIPNPVFFKDTKGRYLGCNNAFETYTGKKRDTLIGKSLFDISPPDLAKIYAAKDRELFSRGGRQEYESQVPDYSGEIRDVILSKAVFHNPDGSIGGLIGTLQDISELKKSEARLLQASDKLSFLVDRLIDSLIITNREGMVRFVNNAACELFSRKREDFIGTAFGFPITMDKIFEITTISPDGISRYAEAKSNTIEWDGEEGYLLSLRDITERKKVEEEREKLDQHVRQVDKIESIGNLAGGIAHDFNNMLSVILGYGQELVYQIPKNDPLHESAKAIVEAGKRSAALTRQLLAFSRRQTLQPEVLALNSIIRNIEKMIRRLIGENIELTSLLSDGLDRVKVDPGQMEQVIVNLAVNARDAMPDGGKLIIETTLVELDEQYVNTHADVPAGKYVMLAIRDNGSGMDEQTQARIFEPFYTTKEKGKGTGLGLATVYGIVKQSGGHIAVSSEPGKGTAFKIYLPRTGEELSGIKAAGDLDLILGKGEMILLVEDESAVRKFCERILNSLNYKVTLAANGGEALLLVEEQNLRPDLVITDVIMPGISGTVLVDRLKKCLPDLKTIYMSGYTDDVIVQHGVLEQGALFIQKPFSREKLARAILNILST